MSSLSPAARRGWSVAARAIAAILGGYGFIWLLTAAMSLLLPVVSGMSRFDSVLTATMASFLTWAVVAMVVFHARSARRACAGLLLGCMTCMLALFLMTGRPWP